MSEHAPNPSIPSGWYPDPSGAPRSRWWDGAAWTAQTAPPVAPGADPAAHPGLSPAAMYAPLRERRPIDPATKVYTVFIWLILFVPLVSLPFSLAYTPTTPTEKVGPGGVETPDLSSVFTPLYVAILGIGIVVWAASIVLAFFDRRALMRRGVERPFPWAWAFLSSAVYIIGRSVIVHGVSKRGLWPIWIEIAIFVLSTGLTVARNSLLAAGIAL